MLGQCINVMLMLNVNLDALLLIYISELEYLLIRHKLAIMSKTLGWTQWMVWRDWEQIKTENGKPHYYMPEAISRAHLENDYSLSISFPHSPPDQSHQPKNCSLHCNCNHNLPLQFPHCPPSQNLQVCVVAIFSLPTLSASYKTWVLLTSPYNHINQSN